LRNGKALVGSSLAPTGPACSTGAGVGELPKRRGTSTFMAASCAPASSPPVAQDPAGSGAATCCSGMET
jgi:hypothetical protein